MPLNPLHTDSAHPPEGNVSPCIALSCSGQLRWNAKLRWSDHPRQKAECRCCAAGFEAGRRESSDAPWMALRSVPAKRHRSEGSLRKAKTRMPGGAFFCLPCFAETKKSEAPCGAQQELSNNIDNQPSIKKQQRIANPSQSPSSAYVREDDPCSAQQVQHQIKSPVTWTGLLGRLQKSYA